MAGLPVDASKYEQNKKELEKLKALHNFKEPDRGDLNDENIQWRTKKPDYTAANLAFFKGRTMNHAAGSLEELVENLVKTWEMEATHKTDFEQWTTIDHSAYKVSANGGPDIPGIEAKAIGNYNALMGGCPEDLWNSKTSDFESSHKAFLSAFPDGFPWEVLSVLSGPPHVVFNWRHWAIFAGTYTDPKGRKHVGQNQLVEMFGVARVTVNEKLKVQYIEIFYKPEDFLRVLQGEKDSTEISKGRSMLGPGCPIASNGRSGGGLSMLFRKGGLCG